MLPQVGDPGAEEYFQLLGIPSIGYLNGRLAGSQPPRGAAKDAHVPRCSGVAPRTPLPRETGLGRRGTAARIATAAASAGKWLRGAPVVGGGGGCEAALWGLPAVS